MAELPAFLSQVTDRKDRIEKVLGRMALALEGDGLFALLLGSTHTSDHEGISAAGATPADRRLTPAIDAEALALGKTLSAASLPVSPAGIVSPVVITRACLRLLEMSVSVIDCGCFVPPQLPHAGVGRRVAQCLSTGEALTIGTCDELFERGLAAGKDMGSTVEYMLLAECVPGGTSTAAALLAGLGYKTSGMISSSLPDAPPSLRRKLIDQGLKAAKLSNQAVRKNPLLACAALGDPMQPFAAGLAIGYSCSGPLFLSGGSQMLAVYALAKEMVRARRLNWAPEAVAVCTTKWVAFDAQSKAKKLADLVGAPLLAACPDFTQSRHAGLAAYEDGNVKEGVGAGGSMIASYLRGASPTTIMTSIDATYDELVVQRQPGQPDQGG